MKKYIILILILASCKNVKSIYTESSLEVSNKSIQQILEKTNAKETNKSVVYFTDGFTGNDTIMLKNGNEIIFRHALKTIDQIGLANVKTVSNDKEVRIDVFSTKELTFVLNTKQLKKFKFIYISKNLINDKYIIEYSNRKKDFL